jgi:hypothetical protein
LVIYRELGSAVEYLLMQTSYGHHHWTPPKGSQTTLHVPAIGGPQTLMDFVVTFFSKK